MSTQTGAPQPVPPPVPKTPARIGLLAGQGDFPKLIAEGARSNGVEVIAYAINGFASAEIETAADQTHWVDLGALDKTIKLMKTHSVSSLIMAGRVPHNSIFQYRHFDARLLKLIAKSVNKKADSLLGAVTADFASEGIQVLDSSLFLKSLMPAAGMLTRGRALTQLEREDIEFAYPLAKTIAGEDIGQTIIVKEKAVIAVEGMEGTDECIKRAGEIAGPGCVVVKVSKPAQDMRFDVPVIGPGTIKNMARAGATALAVSANECLIFHREQVLAQAQEHGIAIVAVPLGQPESGKPFRLDK